MNIDKLKELIEFSGDIEFITASDLFQKNSFHNRCKVGFDEIRRMFEQYEKDINNAWDEACKIPDGYIPKEWEKQFIKKYGHRHICSLPDSIAENIVMEKIVVKGQKLIKFLFDCWKQSFFSSPYNPMADMRENPYCYLIVAITKKYNIYPKKSEFKTIDLSKYPDIYIK